MIAGNFTKTPNWLFGLMPVMTEPELRITLATARETVGRQKKTAGISLTDYEELTGLSRSAVDSGLRRAKARGTIIEVGKGKRGKKLYDFNADYTSKETSSPETIVPETISPDTIVPETIVPVADMVQSSTPTSSPETTRNTKKEVLKEKRKKKELIAPNVAVSHSQETPQPSEPDTQQEDTWRELIKAAAWAWNLDLKKSGSMAGKWVNFCTGQIERGKGKKEPDFYTYQISEPPMTARDIIGYRVWYDANATVNGQTFPIVPETVNRYIETYRASRLPADLEAKIQRRYDEVVLRIKWVLEPEYPEWMQHDDEPAHEPTPEELEQMKTQTLDWSIFGKSHRVDA